jgi:molybdate transport system substrate-binding protein
MPKVQRLLAWFFLMCGCLGTFDGHSQEQITIAAASDLIYCIDELNKAFESVRKGVTIRTSNGSSGNFFAQIQNGAPFDIFLSADLHYPQELIASGMADRESLTVYAAGRIVLWTAAPEIDVSKGLEVLRSPGVRRIAIANPEHAPYGRAAKSALEKAGLWQAVKPKLVFGDNIAQAKQFVQTGNADIGVLALSLVLAPVMKGIGAYWLIPQDTYPRLDQAAVLTARGRNNPAARAYLAFLRSPAAREIFEHFGFFMPKSDGG